MYYPGLLMVGRGSENCKLGMDYMLCLFHGVRSKLNPQMAALFCREPASSLVGVGWGVFPPPFQSFCLCNLPLSLRPSESPLPSVSSINSSNNQAHSFTQEACLCFTDLCYLLHFTGRGSEGSAHFWLQSFKLLSPWPRPGVRNLGRCWPEQIPALSFHPPNR